MKHQDYKEIIDNHLDKSLSKAGGSSPVSAALYEFGTKERDRLVVIALHEIRKGGHGPTWAKTALRLYEDKPSDLKEGD